MRNWNSLMIIPVILIDGRKTDFSILMDDFNAKVETRKDKKNLEQKKKKGRNWEEK